ncbi:MAG TPA: hypothetical protein DCS93_40020 [Microscillaceae bacterium]|nr:hypothetical protein [Microscillaceae bacterium]
MRLKKHLLFSLGLFLSISVTAQAQAVKKDYYPDGKVKRTFDVITKNGKGAGLVTLFAKNGKINQMQVVNDQGIANGPFSAFYTQGANKLQMFGSFKNSKVDGRIVTFHQDTGNIEVVGFYRNGKKAGKWMLYDKNGKFVKSKIYN